MRDTKAGKTKMIVPLSLLLLIHAVVGSVVPSATPATVASPNQPITAAVNDFSISLFNRLSQENGQKNVFVSPLSVSTALSMLLLGARASTAAELSKGLKFDQINTSDNTIHQQFSQVSRYSLPIHSLIDISLISCWTRGSTTAAVSPWQTTC